MTKYDLWRKKAPVLALVAFAALQLTACNSKEERAQGYYENGVRLLSEHSNQKAIVEFRNALRLKKELLPAWRGLAQGQEATEDWEGLLQVLKTILSLDPGDKATRLKLAKFYLVGGAADQALVLAEEDKDNDSRLLALKALIHFKLGDRATAVREAREAIDADPYNSDALVVLAEDRVLDKDPNGALKLLSRDAPGSKKDLQVEALKLSIYAQTKDYTRLEALLKELAAAYPQENAFKKQLVDLYLSLHRPEDAERALRTIAAANPQNPQFTFDVVQFLLSTKGPAAARTELTTLIKGEGDTFPYQLALANLDLNQGRVADASALLKTLINSKVSANATNAKLLLAQLNTRQNNSDAADQILNEILKDDAKNVDALRLRASIRLGRDQIDSAIGDLRIALDAQPQAPDLMLLLATAYERSGSVDLAEKEFADALKESRFNAQVGMSYVAFLKRHGGGGRVDAILNDLAKRYPTNVPILSELAEVKLTRQDWNGAQALAETIKRIGGADGFADRILGTLLSYQHKSDASVAAFEAAMTASPTSAEAMVSMVGALVRAKKVDRAITFLESAVKKDPDNAQAYVMLGEIAQSNGKFDRAQSYFKLAIDRRPKIDIGYRAMSDLYLHQKRWDEALSVIRSGLTQIPDGAVLRLALAATFEAKGDYDAAIAEYDALLKQQPGAMIAANNLASLLANRRNDKASLERAHTLAVSLQGSDVAQFKDTLGWIYFREGNLKAAIPLLEASATKLPRAPAVRFHLGMSYIAAGETAKGAEQLKYALTQSPDHDLETRIRTGLNGAVLQ